MTNQEEWKMIPLLYHDATIQYVKIGLSEGKALQKYVQEGVGSKTFTFDSNFIEED